MPAQKKRQPFGKRVKKLRLERKLSLNDMANETGLAKEYISSLEKGEVIPPVAVILQLSRALGIDSSLLLREEKEEEGRKKHEDYQKRTEAYSYETLTPDARDKHLKAFRVFIDAESDHKGVSYQHPGEEFIYVIKGKLEVIVGENINVLKPGESIHFNSNIVHKLRNLSARKAELVVVLYTP
ncbi:MAG: helix-turn-helix domain-containing protein [Thermodesulfobacteriota bacterium]